METNHTNYQPDRDDPGFGYQNPENHLQQRNLADGESTGEVSKRETHEKRRSHTHYGIGRYRSFSNYSSDSDQPHTSTGW